MRRRLGRHPRRSSAPTLGPRRRDAPPSCFGHKMISSQVDSSPCGDPRIEEVSNGVFAYIQPDGTWFINNTGFVVGQSGILSIDACSTERRTRAYLRAIASVSTQSVRTLVNTHHHGDHTYGNFLFTCATIVGHETCREEILANGLPHFPGIWKDIEWGRLDVAPPLLTFSDSVTLWVDDLACEVRHVGGAAHTTNDVVVWLPERSVLYSGDLLFHGGTPFVLMG